MKPRQLLPVPHSVPFHTIFQILPVLFFCLCNPCAPAYFWQICWKCPQPHLPPFDTFSELVKSISVSTRNISWTNCQPCVCDHLNLLDKIMVGHTPAYTWVFNRQKSFIYCLLATQTNMPIASHYFVICHVLHINDVLMHCVICRMNYGLLLPEDMQTFLEDIFKLPNSIMQF